jgi:glycosyltransferase involved in cell wall biosynthesis
VTGGVQAVIGVPVYENVAQLRSAIESLLAQDHPSFAIVAVDDSSSVEPGEILREYERTDPRLHYARNPARLGLIRNWRRAFELARDLHPEASYFAWGSDHDLWEPSWLPTLAAELDDHPEAVLAYPLNDLISASEQRLRGPRYFDTRGDRRAVRFARVLRRMIAGDMVYGLARVDGLERCGVIRDVVFPDRLLLTELSLQGEFRQIPDLLWHRRVLSGDRVRMPARRSALFAGGPPRSAHLPWWLAHAAALARGLVLRGEARPKVGRIAGAAAAATYLALVPTLHAARRAYYLAGGRPQWLRE